MAKKISTSKERIAEMMTILNIKQIDIVKRTGIPKSSLSNYLSGKRTPNQEQLSVISDPYGINPAWLMGYDVPMWLKDIPKIFKPEEFKTAWQQVTEAPPVEFEDTKYPFLHDPEFMGYVKKMWNFPRKNLEFIYKQIDFQEDWIEDEKKKKDALDA